jgi:hypothetical protein
MIKNILPTPRRFRNKLFGCTTTQATFEIVDLPRANWQHLGPRKWQVIATVAVIVITALVWAVLS